MKLSATFRAPRVDFSKYRQALKDQLSETVARAAFEWLGATTALIPVWSGASLATFMPLASQIGFALQADSVTRINRVNLGLQRSSGEIVADASTGKFEFTYSTTLAHLIYNEFNNANISPDPTLFSKLKNPGPYHFQEKGLEAFQRSVQNVRLPDPTKSFSITTIRV